MFKSLKPFFVFQTWYANLWLSIFPLQMGEFLPEGCWIHFILKLFSFNVSLCVDNIVWMLFLCILPDQVHSTADVMTQ